ncbi:hypothetical protein G6F16_014025 [Rhizopus arrhizus]|nr:hypothetical protein G6F24_018455 [Rhizopus arrhizus]KAG0802873.1 hypothetical protein G6F20_014040 [Rhizopus arrhizus]KAG0804641.1 hypothetical protein G6F19_014144 [Rhizopus arrhizus]KAG0850494.1 hypothetical protein G6F16_014025 [Rhizopus arrhizus]KAG0851366.1 hypothetical protein G6F15_014119 [Rhizopus arrhizus]
MATPAPYKAAALKGKKTAPPAHKPPTTRPRKVLSTRQLQVVARTFTPVSGTHGIKRTSPHDASNMLKRG